MGYSCLLIFLKYLHEHTTEAIQTSVPCDIAVIDKALEAHGLQNHERMALYKVLAGILLIGNITFEDFDGYCRVIDGSKQLLLDVASLFAMDAIELEDCLTYRLIRSLR